MFSFLILIGIVLIITFYAFAFKSNFKIAFPEVTVLALGLVLVLIGIYEPDDIKTSWGEMSKRVKKIESEIRPYAIISYDGKLTHSTFSNEKKFKIDYYDKISGTISFQMSQKPLYYEIRSNYGSNYFCIEKKTLDLFNFECSPINTKGAENPSYLVIESFFGE